MVPRPEGERKPRSFHVRSSEHRRAFKNELL